MPYQLTDIHTSADIGLVATGLSLEELFADAAAGLMSIMVDIGSLKEAGNFPVNLRADELDELLLKWLGEIIYLKDAERFLMKRCQITIGTAGGLSLSGELFGDYIDPGRQSLGNDVKAVTYYKLKVEKTDNIWRGEVVLDL